MGSVDDRVVAMKFDNDQFEKRVGTTLGTISKLKDSLDFKDSAKALSELSTTTNFSLDGISQAVDSIASKFSVMGAIGLSTIQSLTSSFFDFAKNTAGSLLEPILGGGNERAKNIEQAKFQFEGLGIDVEKAMGSALASVKGTAFGLGDAAKAAAQLGASGIEAGDDMTSVLRAIGGSAAMTGASFGEIGMIFTGSAAAGKVTNQDLLQFATRGLNAAAAVGKQLGITEEQVHEMATDGELDFKVFSKAMDQAFGSHATEANKTYAGSLANMRAAFSRLGEAFFSVHNLQMRDLFNTLTPAIDKVKDAVKPLIDMLNVMIGLNLIVLIDKINSITFENLTKAVPNFVAGFSQLFKSIYDIVKAVAKAFQEVFPPSEESKLLSFSEGFAKLIAFLTPSEEVLGKITSIFKGVFSVLSIGITVVTSIAKVIGSLFGVLFGAARGDSDILGFFGGLGDKLFELKKTLVDEGGIANFVDKFLGPLVEFVKAIDFGAEFQKAIDWFDKMRDTVLGFFHIDMSGLGEIFSKALEKVKELFATLFSTDISPATDAIGSATDGIGKATNSLTTRWEQLINIGKGLINFFGSLKDILAPFGTFFVDLIGNIKDTLSGGDFNKLFDGLNTGILAALGVAIAKFFKDGFKFPLSGFMDTIKGSFTELTGVFKAMQTDIKADALQKIAIAVAILAVSLVLLASIDSIALGLALAAMVKGMRELTKVFQELDKGNTGDLRESAGIVAMASGIVLLSGALLILAFAMKVMSTIDTLQLIEGTLAVKFLLAAITKFMEKLPSGKKMIAVGVGIVGLAIGIYGLTKSVEKFAGMDFWKLVQGLGGLAVVLGILIVTMKNMDSEKGDKLAKIGVGILLITAAIKILGEMDAFALAQGIAAFAGAMAILTLSMKELEKFDANKLARSLIATSFLIAVVVGALLVLSFIDPKSILIGVLAIGAIMGVLVFALLAMEEVKSGGEALVLAAGAIVLIAAALFVVGSMPLEAILGGMLGIFGSLLLIAGMSAIFAGTGITETIAALGAALSTVGFSAVLFAGAVALIAVSILVIVVAIGMLADMGAEGVQRFIDLLPQLTTALVTALLNIVNGFLEGVPEILGGIVDVIEEALRQATELIPKIVEFVNMLIDTLIQFMQDNQDRIIEAGWQLLIALLHGADDHIEEITILVSSIITKFMEALNLMLPGIIAAGVQLLVTFINGISANVDYIGDAVTNLIILFIASLTVHELEIIDAGKRAVIKLIEGIGNAAGDIVTSAKNTLFKFLDTISENIQDSVDKGFEIVTNLINGIADSIDKHAEELRQAGLHLLQSIIDGMTGGMLTKGQEAVDGIKDIGSNMISSLTGLFDSHSPSRVMIKLGGDVAEGLAIGLDKNTSAVNSADKFGQNVKDKLTSALAIASAAMVNMDEFNPTITPIVDLTNIASSAVKMGALLGNPSLDASLSYANASALAVESRQRQDTSSTPDTPTVQSVTFEQTINAPRQLSAKDIYRQTKSQFVMAQEELKV